MLNVESTREIDRLREGAIEGVKEGREEGRREGRKWTTNCCSEQNID
jgi:predicted transposase YdaD